MHTQSMHNAHYCFMVGQAYAKKSSQTGLKTMDTGDFMRWGLIAAAIITITIVSIATKISDKRKAAKAALEEEAAAKAASKEAAAANLADSKDSAAQETSGKDASSPK